MRPAAERYVRPPLTAVEPLPRAALVRRRRLLLPAVLLALAALAAGADRAIQGTAEQDPGVTTPAAP